MQPQSGHRMNGGCEQPPYRMRRKSFIINTYATLIARLQGPIARLRGMIARLRDPVARLQGSIARLRDPVARLQGSIARLRDPVARLQGSIARLRDPIGRLFGPIASLRSPVARLFGQSPRLRAPIARLRESIGRPDAHCSAFATRKKADHAGRYIAPFRKRRKSSASLC